MSNKKVTIRTTTVNRPEDDEDDEKPRAPSVPDHDPAREQYAQFMQKFRGSRGCRVRLHRQTPRGLQYCLIGTPEEIDEEYVRLYHAKQPYASEEGLYYVTVELNGELQPPFPIHISPQVGTPGAESASRGGGSDNMTQLLMAQIDRLEQRLTQQDRPPMLEMVDGLAKLDQLRGASGGGNLNMETLLKAVEIGQKLNAPEAESWTGMLMSVAKENAPMLIGLARSLMASRPQAPPPGQVQPPANAEVPAQTIPEDLPVDQQEKLMFQEVINFLKRKARAGSDPNLYVAMIDDNREDPIYAKLLSIIADNDFSAFVALDPELDKFPNRDFFRSIYDGVRRILAEESAMGAHSGGPGGHAADTSGNGATGKKRGK